MRTVRGATAVVTSVSGNASEEFRLLAFQFGEFGPRGLQLRRDRAEMGRQRVDAAAAVRCAGSTSRILAISAGKPAA